MATKPKKLNPSELNALEKSILNKSDDSIGNYLVNGFRIQVSKYNQSSADRIRAFAKRRRDQGLCVACGVKVKRVNERTGKTYKYCDKHHELALKSKKRNSRK